MSSLFPVYPQIACALVLFLASFAFPPHFLRPDSQGVTAVVGGVTAENLQVASATNPTGIDRQTPSLSWELRATLIPDLRRTTSCLGMPRSGSIEVWRALMLI